MTIETIIDHDQPDFEPGDPTPLAQPDGGLIRRSTGPLTAISAGLAWCGFVVLAGTRLLSHSRARAAVWHTAQVAEKLERHVGSFHHMRYPWAFGSPAPEAVDDVKCLALLDEAMHALFPMPLQLPGTKFLAGVLE